MVSKERKLFAFYLVLHIFFFNIKLLLALVAFKSHKVLERRLFVITAFLTRGCLHVRKLSHKNISDCLDCASSNFGLQPTQRVESRHKRMLRISRLVTASELQLYFHYHKTTWLFYGFITFNSTACMLNYFNANWNMMPKTGIYIWCGVLEQQY